MAEASPLEQAAKTASHEEKKEEAPVAEETSSEEKPKEETPKE